MEVPYEHNRVLFVERSGELRLLARLSPQGMEPKGNQVLTGPESVGVDPKPGDLSMSRLKETVRRSVKNL